MATVHKSALVGYTAVEMFTLVDDIASYPDFLPWCSSSAEKKRAKDEVEASITIKQGVINKEFTTRNHLQQGKMIEMYLVDGPFKQLEGFWRFDALGDEGCKVTLDLEFQFSGSLISMTISPVFNKIANTLVDAFCKRAVEVYGER